MNRRHFLQTSGLAAGSLLLPSWTRAAVDLAPQKGVGEVAWRTPLKINGFEVPLADKVDRLLAANAAAMKGGANFVNSQLFLVNEQKYFASTDGSYIDQDIHRIYPAFIV